jgi:hypothetical protein
MTRWSFLISLVIGLISLSLNYVGEKATASVRILENDDTIGDAEFTPDGKRFAIYESFSRRVALYEYPALKLIRVYTKVSGPMIGVSDNAALLLVNEKGDGLKAIEAVPFDDTEGFRVRLPKGALPFAVSASGKRVATFNRLDGSIHVVDLKPDQKAKEIAAPFTPTKMYFSVDGKRLGIVGERNEAVIVDLEKNSTFTWKLPQRLSWPIIAFGVGNNDIWFDVGSGRHLILDARTKDESIVENRGRLCTGQAGSFLKGGEAILVHQNVEIWKRNKVVLNIEEFKSDREIVVGDINQRPNFSRLSGDGSAVALVYAFRRKVLFVDLKPK